MGWGHGFDDGYPDEERLPREIRVEFREVYCGGRTKLQMTWDGTPLGDPLTDNAYAEDGYRFHDAFHLAGAVLLGWSPVTRALMRRKRKSEATVDEVEDGARAGVIEEAISALAYARGKDYGFFEGATAIDYELLRTIRTMVAPFEVRAKSSRDWEDMILQAFDVWRPMMKNRGGVLVGSASLGRIRYEPLHSDMQRPRAPAQSPDVTTVKAQLPEPDAE